MATWVIVIAIICLSVGILAAVLLPFVASMYHVSYTLDGAAIATVAGALVGIVTVVLTNAKKNS